MRQNFLPSFRKLPSSIHRYEAATFDPGMPKIQGAGLSHLAALQLALDGGYRNVLILEDDCLWRVSAGRSNLVVLEDLATRPYDVLLLGGTFVLHDAATHRAEHAYTMAAYVVAAHYLQTLIDNIAESLDLLRKNPTEKMYSVDVWWCRLMAGSLWYIVTPSLVIQDHNALAYNNL